MKYYLVIIQNGNTQAIYEEEDYDTALSQFHSELAYRGDGRTSTMCLIIDGRGGTIKKDYWERPVIPEESNEEEEA